AVRSPGGSRSRAGSPRARPGSPAASPVGRSPACRAGTSAAGTPRPRGPGAAGSARPPPTRTQASSRAEPPLLCVRFERHLQRAELAGGERVVDRLAPAPERIRRPDHPVERPRAGELGRDLERVPPLLPDRLDPARVRADELELAEPERREVGALHGNAGHHDPAAGPGRSEREVERAPRADAVDRHVDPAEQVALAALGPQLHRARRAPDLADRLRRRDDLGRAESRCTPCLATTVIRPGRASSFSASRTRSPTVPAPISRTSAFGSILARRAAWIAHESGSISTARRSESSPGTGWSCERCATNRRLQPPPVSAQ